MFTRRTRRPVEQLMSFPTPQIFQVKRLLQLPRLPACALPWPLAIDAVASDAVKDEAREAQSRKSSSQTPLPKLELAPRQVGAAMKIAAGKKRSSGKRSGKGRRLPEQTRAQAGVAHAGTRSGRTPSSRGRQGRSARSAASRAGREWRRRSGSIAG